MTEISDTKRLVWREKLLDRLLFTYRVVDQESLPRLNEELMKAFQRAEPNPLWNNFEFARIDDVAYTLAVKGKGIPLHDIMIKFESMELPESIRAEYSHLTSEELAAARRIVSLIINALIYMIRHPNEPEERTPARLDGRVWTQNIFLDRLVELARRGSHWTPRGQMRLSDLNLKLEEALLEFGSESPGNLACAENIEYGYIYLPSDPPLVRYRSGLKVKNKPVFVLDIFKKFCEMPLPDELKHIRYGAPDINETEWQSALQMTVLILELFQNDYDWEVDEKDIAMHPAFKP